MSPSPRQDNAFVPSSPFPVFSGSHPSICPACRQYPHPRQTKFTGQGTITRTPPSPSRITCSVQTPDSFSAKWYQDTIAPLDLELSSYHIQNSDAPPSAIPTDYNFVDPESGIMAMVDYASPVPGGDVILEDIRQTLSHNSALYDREARLDLRRALSSAVLRHGAPPGFSALVMDCKSNVVRMAWVGSCGFVLVRDNKIVYRSYSDAAPKDALETHVRKSADRNREKSRMHWLSWGGKATQSATGGYYATGYARGIPQGGPITIDCEEVYADFVELEDNDLIIAGSDGFFANVSEEQILAFVRPVPDGPEDRTLSIANHTCLGSWRWDDVEFIAYYLAMIADNFATAANSKPHLPFPFPPSPHVDDVTVMCVASSFQR